jgi:predicted ATP-grasp superfamily ATP-dependent carboligase
MSEPRLLLVGASVRAAAFSALRAGLDPICVDLFADLDLQARCSASRIPASQYPAALRSYARSLTAGPWMYTGALENHPSLVRAIAQERTLWGNDAGVLRKSRSPRFVFDRLQAQDLPCPRLCTNPTQPPAERRWLLKRRRSAGGAEIRAWNPATQARHWHRGCYLQEQIDGIPAAAVYVSDGASSRLLGVTRQLVGEPWLHAAAFHYCGSVGPWKVNEPLRRALERVGQALVHGCGLRGLFGVDFIVRDGLPWPVEVNPRYTASVEVLEYAGTAAFALHGKTFGFRISDFGFRISDFIIGKAILYARADLVFPAKGPWCATLANPGPIEWLPAFADIPAAGERIPAGRPILTFFARAATEADCLRALQETARALDRDLFPV